MALHLLPADREGPITRHIKRALNLFLNARRNRQAAGQWVWVWVGWGWGVWAALGRLWGSSCAWVGQPRWPPQPFLTGGGQERQH